MSGRAKEAAAVIATAIGARPVGLMLVAARLELATALCHVLELGSGKWELGFRSVEVWE
jgi:hypothetical protein